MNPSVRLFFVLVCFLLTAANPASAAIRAPAAGDLLISEVMANPAAVSDSLGEWFELFNPTADTLVLNQLVLSDNGSNRHTLSADTDLLLGSGEYFLLARNGDSASNGGLVPDYVYSSFTLGNSADAIILSLADTEIARLEYGSGFAVSGASTELLRLPTELANYQPSPEGMTYGMGDRGTPGAAGSAALPVSAVPLPAAGWLFGSGLLALLGTRRRS